MSKIFILFFAMGQTGGFSEQVVSPIIRFQQEFKNGSDCDNALEKLKQDAAKANLKVIVGRCVPAGA